MYHVACSGDDTWGLANAVFIQAPHHPIGIALRTPGARGSALRTPTGIFCTPGALALLTDPGHSEWSPVHEITLGDQP